MKILVHLLVLALASASLSHAQEGQQASVKAPLQGGALEAFVDGVVVSAMEDHNIAGATVAVVGRDDILLLKGYGYADAETREPVDPEKHLFRIASITKTFAATAIMQLEQEGRLSLNTDIRGYLGDIQFDDHLGTITVANLLSHTAGFEEFNLGTYGEGPDSEAQSIKAQLEALADSQVRPPGEVTAYSNYGYSLVGAIISLVSGKDYASYIRDHILEPLDMSNSTHLLQVDVNDDDYPWLEELREREARSHEWNSGWYEPVDYPFTRPVILANGGLSTTAADMARYVQMHLNRGTLDGVEILAPATWDKMSQDLYRNGPYTQANAHGFWSTEWSGHRVLRHSGSTHSFRSHVAMLPELGIGIFIATNIDSGGKLNALPRRVIEHFYPVEAATLPSPPTDFAERYTRYTGSYLSTRRNITRLEKLGTALFGALAVSTTGDGYLVVDDERYVELEPDVFQSLVNGSRIQFRGDQDGRAKWLIPSGGSSAYERPRFFEQRETLTLPLVAMTLTSLVLIIAAIRRLIQRSAKPTAHSMAQRTLLGAALTWIIAVSLLVVALGQYTGSSVAFYELDYPSPMLRLFNAVLWLATLLTLLAIASTPRWFSTARGERLGLKLAYGAAGLIFLVFAFAMFQWNMYSLD
ncbi:MAG: serine hydrolase domain-containing protein [Pseudomonadota bacterium]